MQYIYVCINRLIIILLMPVLASEVLAVNNQPRFVCSKLGRVQTRPTREKGSQDFTRVLFEVKKGNEGVIRPLIGYLSIKNHTPYKGDHAIYSTKNYDQYWVAFCYEAGQEEEIDSNNSSLKKFSQKGEKDLMSQTKTVGVGQRGVRLVHCSYEKNLYSLSQNKKKITKKPKAKQGHYRNWDFNSRFAQSAWNRSTLDKKKYMLEGYRKLYIRSFWKIFFKVAANYTSQKCMNCYYIHSQNCKTQVLFSCVAYRHIGHVNSNRSKSTQWRVIELTKKPGVGLLKEEILSPEVTGGNVNLRNKKEPTPHIIPNKSQTRNRRKAAEALSLEVRVTHYSTQPNYLRATHNHESSFYK